MNQALVILLGRRILIAIASLTAGLIAEVALIAEADAHAGRRFEVEVIDGKLQAQGINTGPDDGAPAIRPYVNAIHHHWHNVEESGFAFATLPGFDVPPNAALRGQRLEIDLISVRRWVDPPTMPGASTVVKLDPLEPAALLSVSAVNSIDSGSFGALTLANDLPITGAYDLDPYYQINDLPYNEIYVLSFVMSAHSPAGEPSAIKPSDAVHVILAPDGATPHARLHHASLFLEAYVVSVPEPQACWLVLIGGLARNHRWRSRLPADSAS